MIKLELIKELEVELLSNYPSVSNVLALPEFKTYWNSQYDSPLHAVESLGSLWTTNVIFFLLILKSLETAE